MCFYIFYTFALHDYETAATLDNMIEAEVTYVKLEQIFARRFGDSHHETLSIRGEITKVREYIARVRECATCEGPSCQWAQYARRNF